MVQIKCSSSKACNDYDHFNIYNNMMAKYTFLLFYEYMIDLKNESYIVHLEKYELYHDCRR